MSDATRIRILCVDDHPLLREGIATVIDAQADMTLAGEAASGREAIAMFRQLRPDVTLMDLRLPDMSGISATAAIRSEFPSARIIMLTTFKSDTEIVRSLEAGASGFLLKSASPTELVATIRRVHAGKKFVAPEVAAHLAEHLTESTLTPREMEIVRLVAAGNRNRDVAVALSIAEATVKVHVQHIIEKLGARDRTEAVVLAIRRGIIQI